MLVLAVAVWGPGTIAASAEGRTVVDTPSRMQGPTCIGLCLFCSIWENKYEVVPNTEIPDDEEDHSPCGHHVPCAGECRVSLLSDVKARNRAVSGRSYSPPALDWCEYYSEESGYIEGECATQQALDEAAATIAAMDAEITGAQQEVELVEYCLMNPDDYETCSEQTTLGNAPSVVLADAGWPAPGAGVLDLEDGSNDLADPFALDPFARGSACVPGNTPTEVEVAGSPGRSTSCTNEAAQAAIGVVAWVGSKAAAAAVMSAAAPPATAVGWAVFGALTSGWAAVSAVRRTSIA